LSPDVRARLLYFTHTSLYFTAGDVRARPDVKSMSLRCSKEGAKHAAKKKSRKTNKKIEGKNAFVKK
jgi:hypothetical protein